MDPLSAHALEDKRIREVIIHSRDHNITVNIHFEAEIADNTESWEKGLMGRSTLKKGHGMLFVFPAPREVAFWMKDTLIPLDMLFVDKSGEIVHIVENAAPGSLEQRRPPMPVASVLEVAGGSVSRYKIQVGDTLTYEP